MRMIEKGITPDIIGAGANLDNYKVIFSPFMFTLEEHNLAERIKKWVSQGGTWIVGPMTDIRDKYSGKYTDNYTGIIEEMTGISFDYFIFDRRAQLDIRWNDGEKFSSNLAYHDMMTAERPLVTVEAGVNKSLIGKAVVAEANYGKGRVIVLGALPDCNSLYKIINMVCPSTYNHSENIISVPRKGDDVSGLIVGEFDGKEGWIELPQQMTDILTGEKYSGKVNIRPYSLFVLV